jgi:hypothetical protein
MNMKSTFPEDRKLAEPERLRTFAHDKALLDEAVRETGIESDEIKRRAIHVGLPRLLELLKVAPERKKAA